MKQGYLADYFEGAAVKTLSMVDATPSGSNQHEIGTTKTMREEFLGMEKIKFDATYIWLDDNEQAISHDGFATHYDSRENNPKRPAEWRLYYTGNPVTELMSAGDFLFFWQNGRTKTVWSLSSHNRTRPSRNNCFGFSGCNDPGIVFNLPSCQEKREK